MAPHRRSPSHQAATSRERAGARSMSVEVPPFHRFLDRHREEVLRFLVGLVGPDEADDCFQETFLSALRAYPRLRDGANLRAWVLTIAHRKGIDAHRGRRRRPRPVEVVPDGAAPAAGTADPALWGAVGALPAGQRGAVLLRFVHDLPYREVAQVLGCSEPAARQRVREGLKALRKVVE